MLPVNFHIVPLATRSAAPAFTLKGCRVQINPTDRWRAHHYHTHLHTPHRPFSLSHLPLPAAFVTTAIISGVLMAQQTLLLRERDMMERKREKRRTEGEMEEQKEKQYHHHHHMNSCLPLKTTGEELGEARVRGVTCWPVAPFRVEGWQWERGGSHTYQGGCELISTLEREREGVRKSEKKGERLSIEMKDGDEERMSGKSWVLEPSYKTRRRRGGGQSDRKGGVREGCRRGVKTHLFLDGCEFRLERRVAWEHSIA